MPKITITEKDLTSPGMLNATSNTVYVPGTACQFPKELDREHLPRLYSSLTDFQNDFGESVPIIKIGDTGETGKRYDPGYIYATELLSLGVPVLYDCYTVHCEAHRKGSAGTDLPHTADNKGYVQSGITDTSYNTILKWIQTRFTDDTDIFLDKGNYNFKFLTSGGYVENTTQPKYALGKAMAALAFARGDCIALIDHPYLVKPKDFLNGDLIKSDMLPSLGTDVDKYAAMFTPWGVYAPPSIGSPDSSMLKETTIEMPGSFGYVLAYASSVKNNPGWYAMAGGTRGKVPYLEELCYHLSEPVAEKYQSRSSVSINPILNVSPFGLRIWGNRTLFDNSGKGNLTASSFLNIRNLCSDIKKTVWTAARTLTFEQNSDILWVNFKALITPLLDEMVSGNGLSGYQLKKRTSKQKAELSCVIRLFAIEAVEDFDIEIQLADSSTAILE